MRWDEEDTINYLHNNRTYFVPVNKDLLKTCTTTRLSPVEVVVTGTGVPRGRERAHAQTISNLVT